MNESANNPEDSELRLERLFDDTRQRVFEAWTDPDQLEIWCKPFDHTIVMLKCDPVQDGPYLCILKSKRGSAYSVYGAYAEIVPNEKIVFTQTWNNYASMPVMETQATVFFEDKEGQTRMTFLQKNIPTGKFLERFKKGWSEAFENLEEHLFTEAFGII